jgi:ASPIC and UnbV/FG-GAP-like repeat
VIRSNRRPLSYAVTLAVAGASLTVLQAPGAVPPASGAVAAGCARTPVAPATPAPTGGLFTDVTSRSGLLHSGKAWGAAWGDPNSDGWPDLWTGNHSDPPQLWLNQRSGTFNDRPMPVGEKDHHGGIWGDVNNDGHEDLALLTDTGGGTSPRTWLLMNDGAGNLLDRAAEYAVTYDGARGRTPLWLDYDRDGRLDMFVPTHVRRLGGGMPPALFRQGAGAFFNTTEETGLQSLAGRDIQWAQLGDLDGDGVLDFVAGPGTQGYPAHVYRMNTMPFQEITSTLGRPPGGRMVDMALGDYDNDGRVDIFGVGGERDNDAARFDARTVRARLTPRRSGEYGFTFKSTGSLTFEVGPDYLAKTLGAANIFIGRDGRNPTGSTGDRFTIAAGDPSNIGIKPHVGGQDQGIFVGYDPGNQTWTVLYSETAGAEDGLGDLTFVVRSTSQVSAVAGVGFKTTAPGGPNRLLLSRTGGWLDCTIGSGIAARGQGVNVAAGDFNNDMYLDLFVVNTRGTGLMADDLYLNQGDGTFRRVPAGGGAAGTSSGRGDVVAVADYDRNGALDLVVTNGRKPDPFWGPTQLFRNTGNRNHWVQLDLVGTTANRSAIGAQVVAKAGGVTQLREVNGGVHERGAQNHSRVHFGLGSNSTVDLTINWPSGRTQSLRDVAADQLLSVQEPVG